MHQTKKDNQWYFGMKAHLGVDSRTKLIHAAVLTPANIADSAVLPDLCMGARPRVWGDQAYPGQRAVIRQHAPKARDFANRRHRHRRVVDETERAENRTKSRCARVEHPIEVINGCWLCKGTLLRIGKKPFGRGTASSLPAGGLGVEQVR
jgi:IS5 family transposase